MNTFVVESEIVRIPAQVTDLDSFRRWARSDDFPETGRICYLNGEVWVDMSKEQFFSHNQVKGEFNVALGGLTKQQRLGRYVPDGMLLSSDQADRSRFCVTHLTAMFWQRRCRAGSPPKYSEDRSG